MALKFNPFTSNFDFVNKSKSLDLIHGRVQIPKYSDLLTVDFSPKVANLNAPVILSIESDDTSPIFLNWLVKKRGASKFDAYFNAPVDSDNYYLNYYVAQNAMASLVDTYKNNIINGQDYIDVSFSSAMPNLDYFISCSIETNEGYPVFSNFIVCNKTLNSARIKFNSNFESGNYFAFTSLIY